MPYSDLSSFGFKSTEDFFERSAAVWNPDKVRFWHEAGTPLIIGKREHYYLFDLAGKRYIDMHLNGGTYNLGHRNAELMETLSRAMLSLDIGNHHFPAPARTALAEALLGTCHAGMSKVAYATGGGEANDIAIKSARYATGRRTVVGIRKAFHGCTGLALGATDERFSARFLSSNTQDFIHVPHNDLDAIRIVLESHDIAAVIMETIPATYGFPMPDDGYLPSVKRLCEEYGTLYIADEVQTGLMRTGQMWATYGYGVDPDILVTAKGLGGGLYPMAAVVLSERCGQWLDEDGWGHVSTGGGSELGCVMALKVLEISQRRSVQETVRTTTEIFAKGLQEIQAEQSNWLLSIRQNGLVIGLEFDHPRGAQLVMRELYENGVWAIFSTLDPRVLQFKPGLLISPSMCADVLDRLTTAVAAARGTTL